MPRVARIVIPNCPHHMTQRGNNRQDVFFVDDDRMTYFGLLVEEAQKYGLSVDGYCLMDNHIHLIATPQAEESLAKTLGRTHFRYTQYLNRFHRRSGHLWQNRFYSCALDEGHYWTAMAYVEQNPVRARRVRCPWRYRWSSAAAHCGLAKDRSGLLDLDGWNRRASGNDWKLTLGEMLDDKVLSSVRLNTHRGRPLGSDGFLSKIEAVAGRRLRPLPVGRPRKKRKNR
jgi:putative transposase